MGTEKRERQKRNRDARRETIERRSRQSTTRKRGVKVLAVILVVVALVGFVFATGDSGDDTATDITEAPLETTAATTDGSATQQREFADAPQLCIDPAKEYTATFETTQGEFTIRLLADRAPGTVNSFVNLARWKYFDGTKCHRVIEDFVVQCGDPTATGSGGPGYSFADELPALGEYKIGSIAMANSGPNTNGSQFFIITGNNGAALPPQYSLFGEVTAGLDTTVKAMGALFNPDPAANGVPPAGEIVLKTVKITEG